MSEWGVERKTYIHAQKEVRHIIMVDECRLWNETVWFQILALQFTNCLWETALSFLDTSSMKQG